MQWEIVKPGDIVPERTFKFALTGEFREPRPGEWFLQIVGSNMEPRERPVGKCQEDVFYLRARPILKVVPLP